MPHTFQTIVHPTDFSDTSADAFAHALRIAIATKSKLYLVHVAESKYEEQDGFPHIRHALALWRLMNEDDPPSAVGNLGIKVAKIVVESQDPLRGLIRFLAKHPSDLIVLATHGRCALAARFDRRRTFAYRAAANPFRATDRPRFRRPDQRQRPPVAGIWCQSITRRSQFRRSIPSKTSSVR